ncbi:MAG: hypothetical protein ACRCZF_23775, partial [Gemmataceae bacterium]
MSQFHRIGMVGTAWLLGISSLVLGQSLPMPSVPATPTVQLVIVVPQDSPPGANLPYTIRLTNPTGATAYNLRVRMPLPVGAESIVSTEPKGSLDAKPNQKPTQCWEFTSLGPNATETIQVTVKPKADANSVNAKAYVTFEHGQQVVTKLNKPKLKVRTQTPKTALAGDSIPVRITIINEGRVAINEVKLTTNISPGFD